MTTTIKSLSLTQPWGTLIAIRAKRIETRSWSTAYRGPLAIHAAKGLPKDTLALFFTQPFASVLRAEGFSHPSELPRGAVIAICDLVGVVPTRTMTNGGCRWDGPDGRRYAYELTEQEEAFGDYSEGRYAWLLDNVRPLPEPVPAKGSLGLWNWTPPGGCDER